MYIAGAFWKGEEAVRASRDCFGRAAVLIGMDAEFIPAAPVRFEEGCGTGGVNVLPSSAAFKEDGLGRERDEREEEDDDDD